MEIKSVIDMLQSLAQETRLGVFRCLVKAGPKGLSAGDIGTSVGAPASTLSFHLNHLTQAGLLARRRDGRTLWYSVRFEQMASLMAYLMEDCCQGQLSLDARDADCCATTDEEPST